MQRTKDCQGERDITILGGGLAGLTLGLHCRKLLPDANILILEKNQHPAPESAFKVGESSVEVGAHYFAKVLELEEHIHTEQLPKLGLRFFFSSGNNRAIEDRFELGGTEFPPAPSYQIDRGRFENFLGQRCREKGITFLDGAQVKQAKVARGTRLHEVEYSHEGREATTKSRWIADASGRAGILKRELGLSTPSTHKANAAWFRVGKRISIDDWSVDQSWKSGYGPDNSRWLSTNHLMGEGYWVWLIPLSSGSTSVGIVADDNIHPISQFNSLEKSLAWLDQYEPQCAEKIRECDSDVQDFLVMKNYARNCKKVFSSDRWGIVGEAGCFADPFYSPGSDFIAFGNTLLATLIQRDFQGKSNFLHTPFYEMVYQRIFSGTLKVYEGMYPLFGHHQVMPLKVFWDYVLYWKFTAYLQIHGRLTDMGLFVKNWHIIKKLDALNRSMQDFFIEWSKQLKDTESQGCFDLLDIPVLREANRSLNDDISAEEFKGTLRTNLDVLESIYWEIVDSSGIEWRAPFSRKNPAHNNQSTIHGLVEASAGVSPSLQPSS